MCVLGLGRRAGPAGVEWWGRLCAVGSFGADSQQSTEAPFTGEVTGTRGAQASVALGLQGGGSGCGLRMDIQGARNFHFSQLSRKLWPCRLRQELKNTTAGPLGTVIL